MAASFGESPSLLKSFIFFRISFTRNSENSFIILICSTSVIFTEFIIRGKYSGYVLMTSLQNPWKVLMLTEYAGEPIISASLRFMEAAALSVKVSASIFSGSVSVRWRMFAIRKVSTWVLPVPGPATTITGPSIASTASRCCVFNCL